MSTDVLACASCGKSYRVPDPTKTYPCRACGGRVGAVVDDANPRPAPTRAAAAAQSLEASGSKPRCPACAKDAEPGARFCEHCGAGIDGRSPAEAADPATRALAVRALAKAKKTIDLARSFYVGGAALHALWFLGIVVFDVKTGQSIVADWLSLLPPLVLLVLHVLAARRIVDQPVAWSVSLAALKTLDVAWAVLIGMAAHSLLLPVIPILWC
ncbi:MAG: zinc ribbon domain-containing protein, partial [Planctomycetes bacterium]|nr:zinc ribbon domain-containing protein [Planctomycetota bacterium]